MARLYADLASWWPLLSPPEDYAHEAELFLAMLAHALGGSAQSLLELGSGGGHLACNLPAELDLVLLDRSPDMLAASRQLNPGRTHVQADMCDVDLGRQFDAVLLHDAVMYMVDPDDLRAALATAARHLRPGGAFLLLPDVVVDSFEEGMSAGGGGPDWRPIGGQRSARMLEWCWDPDPTDSSYRVDMTFLLREADGSMQSVHDVHTMALHSRAAYWQALVDAGLEPVEAPPMLAAQCGSVVFLSRKPTGTGQQ